MLRRRAKREEKREKVPDLPQLERTTAWEAFMSVGYILNDKPMVFLLDRRSSYGPPTEFHQRKLTLIFCWCNLILVDKNMKALSYPFAGACMVVVSFGSTNPDQQGARKSVIYYIVRIVTKACFAQ